MKILSNKILRIGSIVLALSAQSCQDLDENLYSSVTGEDFFKTEEQFLAALGSAYGSLYSIGGNGTIYPLQEVTTDEMVVPTRGADWDDGGAWRRLHQHEYTFEEPTVGGSWSFVFTGINNCNRLIYTFENAKDVEIDKEKFVAELKVLRGLFYWYAIDLFGNVPIVDKFDVPADFLPETKTRKEVFDFVVNDIKANLTKLETKKSNDNTSYRMNYYAAQALLAKLYLNAEVYTGAPMWNEAIAACDEIINSGMYSLTTDFFDNFKADNQNSPEFIFAIPYDAVNAPGFNLGQMTLHYGGQQTYNLAEQPWNGFASVEEFYNSFEDKDVRKKSFLTGFQKTPDGQEVLDNSAEPTDPDGKPLNYTPHITSITKALRQEGARIGKWQFQIGAKSNLNNDFAIFRYGDVLLMKAEALHRLSPGNGEALKLVNDIRKRAELDEFTELTDENLLAERGREMFAETYRRQDLIRFGKYNDARWEKAVSDPHYNIFPIPRAQIETNPNLKQNPGYN